MVVSMNIRIEDHKAEEVIKKLTTLNDLRKPMKQSGIYMEKSIGGRFKRAKWKPLSEATGKIHPRRKGGKPLNDTGKLKGSVTSGAVINVGMLKLSYGTNLKYAPMHNFGGVSGWGMSIPKREFLYFDEKDEKAIRAIFGDYVKELTK